MKSIASFQARLLNLARERGSQFQDLLNSLGAEQFLYRLSISSYAENFIFKGGTLLTYLTESNRKTRDLDFSIKDLDGDVNAILEVIKSITELPVDDGIVWTDISGEVLSHPEMETPGARAHCHFLLGKMKGAVHLDVAYGDRVDAILASLPRLKYRGEPFFSEELFLHVYTPEAIFAEKIYIAQSKRAQNTRMKDYYDLHRLCDYPLESAKLIKSIQHTYLTRHFDAKPHLSFTENEAGRLETYWGHFLNRDKLEDAPQTISEVISKVNAFLDKLYGRNN